MQPIRTIYRDAPDSIDIPEALRHQPVEIIIRLLSDHPELTKQVDENGWPPGFFDQTFSSIPDLPDREWQGDYEQQPALK